MSEVDYLPIDIHNDTDKEIEIVHALAQRVLEFEAMLCEVSDICGEIDRYGLMVKSKWSNKFANILYTQSACLSSRRKAIQTQSTANDH